VRSERHTGSSSRKDDDAEEAAEPAEHAKDEPGDSDQQVDDLLDDIDGVLSEIENPEQWVREFVQKPGQ
jgi:ubiquitin-like protein Pup